MNTEFIDEMWYDFQYDRIELILDKFRKLVGFIFNGKVDIRKNVEYSFAHKLGFQKFVLLDFGENHYQLRLHEWNTVNQHMPHDHPWDFQSLVLKGQLNNKIFVESSSGNPVNKIIARSDFVSKGFIYKNCGARKIKLHSEYKVHAGQVYRMNWHDIHATIIKKTPVLTLFIRGKVKRYESSTYSSQHLSREKYKPRNISTDDYLIRLKQIVENYKLLSTKHPNNKS